MSVPQLTYLIAVLVGLLILTAARTNPKTSPPLGRAPNYAKASKNKAVVKVITSDNGMCSGFVYTPNVVITAGHCVDEKGKFNTIQFFDGRQESFEVVCKGGKSNSDGGEDYAVLHGNTNGIKGFTKTERPLGYSNPNFYHIGFGEKGSPVEYPAFYITSDIYGVQMFVSRVYYGDSGGPVLTFQNELAGIAVSLFYYNGMDYPMMYATPITRINKCEKLKDLK
jgi:hypothetical protein